MDCRRLFSMRPETGPGEDSREGGPKPGESERTEPSSERVPREGEGERPAGEVDLEIGLEFVLLTCGSDLLRPRGPTKLYQRGTDKRIPGYRLAGGLKLSPRLFDSCSKLACRETGAGSMLIIGAGNWSA